ncbi:MAG: hypothetical protein LBJ46_03290 [Planctomycetota bacterium]|jgi:hypothetical protein|nr:hypothetical protein [Planctomycetota bacterium]
MAKEGKKLELYEILAAKRAKGKLSMPVDKTGPMYEADRGLASPPPPRDRRHSTAEERLVIVDDAVKPAPASDRSPPRTERLIQPRVELAPEMPRTAPVAAYVPQEYVEPIPEPRRRSAREVHFGLDTIFVLFVVVLALVGSTYFLGYKRGQEERPAGLVGLSDIENANPNMYGLRNFSPAARSTIRPPEQDFTLVLRTEPATDDPPERLEMELAEAMARGSREVGTEVPGFLFRNTRGEDVRYVLAVGLAKTANDPELERLLRIYNTMEGISLSREPRPYIGCQIAQVRDLGTPVD